MRDKRPVDELSIEELERILAIRKREARQKRLERMQQSGRVIDTPVEPARVPDAYEPEPVEEAPDPVALALAALTQPDMPPQAQLKPPPAPPVTQPREFNGGSYFEDGDAEPLTEPERKQKARKQKRLLDRVLMLVEVAAVLAIVVIAANLFGAIQTLERETASAQALADEQRRAVIPTIAPTPQVRAEHVVLPGGHKIVGGVPQFNYDEVPAHLVPLVQSQWVQPVINRPPRTSETALSLVISKINVNGTIVQGVDEEALKQGVGQLPNGVHPGDDFGNVVFAAHNDIYGQLFRRLDELEPGDQLTVQTETRIHTYTVTETLIVGPNDVYVMDNRGGATLTLISCYPYMVNDKRIVVYADRVS